MRSRATQNILPQAVAEMTTIGHAERPAEFDLLNVPAGPFAILWGQPEYSLPHGPVAEGGFIEERRELPGAADRSCLLTTRGASRE